MVSIGQIVRKEVIKPPKGQVLDENFIGRFLELHGFHREVAGDDFQLAINALCVAAGQNRGLLVTGANGCGKTRFLSAVHVLMLAPSQWISCTDEYELDWLANYPRLHQMNVILDDLGAERFKYGDFDRVGEFICRWYERHDPRRLLFVSTNLTGGEIDARYGGRVFDRLRELCVILPMKGASKRNEIVVSPCTD